MTPERIVEGQRVLPCQPVSHESIVPHEPRTQTRNDVNAVQRSRTSLEAICEPVQPKCRSH